MIYQAASAGAEDVNEISDGKDYLDIEDNYDVEEFIATTQAQDHLGTMLISSPVTLYHPNHNQKFSLLLSVMSTYIFQLNIQI